MNVFIEEDEEAMIGCTGWPRVNINAEVGGSASYIAGVELGSDWIAKVEVGLTGLLE